MFGYVGVTGGVVVCVVVCCDIGGVGVTIAVVGDVVTVVGSCVGCVVVGGVVVVFGVVGVVVFVGVVVVYGVLYWWCRCWWSWCRECVVCCVYVCVFFFVTLRNSFTHSALSG